MCQYTVCFFRLITNAGTKSLNAKNYKYCQISAELDLDNLELRLSGRVISMHSSLTRLSAKPSTLENDGTEKLWHQSVADHKIKTAVFTCIALVKPLLSWILVKK